MRCSKLKIKLLGTAASEGFPAIFCKCKHCKKARQLGGKNIRTRTSALIDGNLKVDFPPDSHLHVLRYGEEVMNYGHLLITHTHHDHFYPEELSLRSPVFAHDFGEPLHVYGNQEAIRLCKQQFEGKLDYFALHEFQYFETHEIDGAFVTALPADHKPDEDSFIYLIEKYGKTLLYGHDTGFFPEETFEWLKNKKIDLALLDCTNGLIEERENHMNIDAIIEIKEIFKKTGTFHKDTIVVATHFSHNTGLMHSDLESILTPKGIEVAYDGIEFKVT